jgi:hypothetical protein
VTRRDCYNGRRAPVAQLDRASGYEPEGRLFESARAHHRCRIPGIGKRWRNLLAFQRISKEEQLTLKNFQGSNTEFHHV